MSSRLNLHDELCGLLGSKNVYFQPPESTKMNYPAIVYSLSKIDKRFANDDAYTRWPIYQVTVIDKDPESVISEKLSMRPRCRFDRHYTADGLNHDVYTLY